MKPHALPLPMRAIAPHVADSLWQSVQAAKHAAVPEQVDCGACSRFLNPALALPLPAGSAKCAALTGELDVLAETAAALGDCRQFVHCCA